MAKLNGKGISFYTYTLQEIGEMIVRESGKADGKGITIELSDNEEEKFVAIFGFRVGMAFCDVICDAVKKNGGDATGLSYRYHNGIFTT